MRGVVVIFECEPAPARVECRVRRFTRKPQIHVICNCLLGSKDREILARCLRRQKEQDRNGNRLLPLLNSPVPTPHQPVCTETRLSDRARSNSATVPQARESDSPPF